MSTLDALKAVPPRDWIGLFVFPAVWIFALLFFAVRCALRGMPRSPRLDKVAKTRVLPRFILEYGYWMMTLPVRAIVALHISADVVTYASLAGAAVSAVLCGAGELVWGGWTLLGSFALDAMD